MKIDLSNSINQLGSLSKRKPLKSIRLNQVYEMKKKKKKKRIKQSFSHQQSLKKLFQLFLLDGKKKHIKSTNALYLLKCLFDLKTQPKWRGSNKECKKNIEENL